MNNIKYKVLNLDKIQSKTFIIDIDGVIFYHNTNILIPGIDSFFKNNIKSGDKVILTTARSISKKTSTIIALQKYNIPYNTIIFDLPTGERILINDKKPRGMITAYSINIDRDTDDLNNIIIQREREV